MAKIKVTNPKQIINGGAKKYYFKVKGVGGIKGDKGDKGDTGSQGPQGPQGNAATIMVGSTTTLPTGYDATVTNTGTINNAILNFGIPRGIKGDTGAKGDKGDKGDKGEQGNTGPQGPAGQNATVYIGTTTTGAPGTQASVYNSGTDRNAVLNFTIPQGAKGDTGATGPQGPAGQDGQNFTPTIVETLPTTGDQNKLYLTPKNYTTGTATGNPITISLGEDAGQITDAKLDGDTYQQTYTGKNLLNAPDAKVVGGEMTCTTVESNHFSCSGTVSESWGFNIVATRTTISTIPAGNYVLSISKALAFPVSFQLRATSSGSSLIGVKTISAGSTSETFTLSEAANIFTFWSAASQNTQINDTFTVQIELGSTATPYEPYVGGQASPNPDYPQQIQTVTGEQTVEVVGKNIINATILQNAWSNNDGVSIVYSSQYVRTVEYTPVDASTTYTLSYLVRGSVVMRGNILQYDSSKSFISSISIANNTTFTTTSSTAFVRLNLFHPDDLVPNDITNLQLELGSQASSYAPYSKQTLPISLGSIELCKLGTYQDYIYKDGDSWKVHKDTGKYTFDGTEHYNWDGTVPRVYISQSTLESLGIYCAMPSATSVLPTAASNKYVGKTFDDFYTNRTSNGFAMSSSGKNWNFGDKSWANVEDAGADMQGTIVYYALLTAYKTDTVITDATLIAQLEAVRTASLQASNTITNTANGTNLAGDLELGYYEYDPTNRYDKWLWLDLNNNYEKLGS